MNDIIIRVFYRHGLVTICLLAIVMKANCQEKEWLEFSGNDGPGKGRQIVLVSGDEEYRSEETLPLLARILSEQHGFSTTVLFAIDQETGTINPDNRHNIPGLHKLAEADLLILFTRFRELPDEQMKYIDAYLKSGKPVIGLRTATHAFSYNDRTESNYARYGWNHSKEGWKGGFGKKILGETWVEHHGVHGEEGTRGLIDGIQQRNGHMILRNVEDIWVPTDVYGIRDLPEGAEILVWGQPTRGMTPEAPLNVEKTLMPVAWTNTYQIANAQGKVFATTMGASVDMLNEGLRRMLINACYWALDMGKEMPSETTVGIPGDFSPTMFGFGEFVRNKYPSYYR